jgi:hypothetical protein
MLISGVDAVLGKVGGVGIVDEVIDGGKDGLVKDFCEVEFARGIEGSINTDGNKSCKEGKGSEEDKGKWSSNVSLDSWRRECLLTCARNEAAVRSRGRVERQET